eukprot:197044_1
MVNDYCNTRDFSASYLEYAICTSILIILQLILMIRTIFNECKMKKLRSDASKGRFIRFLFILLQFIGLLEMLNDLGRLVIDPYTLIFRDTIMCDIVAYAPKFITTI